MLKIAHYSSVLDVRAGNREKSVALLMSQQQGFWVQQAVGRQLWAVFGCVRYELQGFTSFLSFAKTPERVGCTICPHCCD